MITAKIQLLRAAIKALLVNEWTDAAGVTHPAIWEEAAVLTDRQSDIWNDVAVAIGTVTHGAVAVISVIDGNASEEDGLENDLTMAVVILSQTNPTPEQEPDEILWEKTVRRLHNGIPIYTGGANHWNYRLRYQGFSDASDLIPKGSEDAVQLARQTIFKVRFSLEPDA